MAAKIRLLNTKSYLSKQKRIHELQSESYLYNWYYYCWMGFLGRSLLCLLSLSTLSQDLVAGNPLNTVLLSWQRHQTDWPGLWRLIHHQIIYFFTKRRQFRYIFCGESTFFILWSKYEEQYFHKVLILLSTIRVQKGVSNFKFHHGSVSPRNLEIFDLYILTLIFVG